MKLDQLDTLDPKKEREMAESGAITMIKGLVKHKLGIGELTKKQRFLIAQVGIPDRIPTLVIATNVEPSNIDEDANYVMLSKDIQANLDLFEKLMTVLDADLLGGPGWLGFMGYGVAELGTEFEISERLVPYPIGFPIKEKSDLEAMELPTEVSGYFKMYLDLTLEGQKRYPDMAISIGFDGPWDLAMLLRGSNKLPMDLRIHKDYYGTDDPDRREKIKQRGDPDLYPAIMEFCTELAIRLIELAKQYGISLMGGIMLDQFAAEPVLSRADFVKYASPYIQRVWLSHKKKLRVSYPCPSPMQMKSIIENEPSGVADQIWFTNYIFHTTEEGITLPEYDRQAFELAKEYKKNFMYMIHGKFLRDATEEKVEEQIKRVCDAAVDVGVSVTITLGVIPPGVDLEKVNYALNLVKKYGRY